MLLLRRMETTEHQQLPMACDEADDVGLSTVSRDR